MEIPTSFKASSLGSLVARQISTIHSVACSLTVSLQFSLKGFLCSSTTHLALKVTMSTFVYSKPIFQLKQVAYQNLCRLGSGSVEVFYTNSTSRASFNISNSHCGNLSYMGTLSLLCLLCRSSCVKVLGESRISTGLIFLGFFRVKLIVCLN